MNDLPPAKTRNQSCCVPFAADDSTNVSGESSAIVEPSCTVIGAGCAVSLGGEWFMMGSDDSAHPEDGENPVRCVWIDKFAIATTAVSNKDLSLFVDATGYRTEAERAGSSFVFHGLLRNPQVYPVSSIAPWWRDVPNACWRTPEGTGSSINDRLDHPAVHITLGDALNYCRWSGSRLASEAEWEYAARGGLAGQPFPWGKDLTAEGRHRCNIWQGRFPNVNTLSDGYLGTAPVTAYQPNAFGLYNTTGNVWEWVSDRFTRVHSPRKVTNPKGPLNGNRFVAKGGSYLCHESYCSRYRTSSRQALPPSTSAGNLGFRIAIDKERLAPL